MENLQTIKLAINNIDRKIADRVAANGDTQEDTEASEFLSELRGTVMVFEEWCEVFAMLVLEDGSNKTLLDVHFEIKRLLPNTQGSCVQPHSKEVSMSDTVWSEELTQGTLKVSILQVIRSAAGHYVGRACLETDEDSLDYCGGMEEPFSRETGYYPTEEAATQALSEGFPVRDCVENDYAYAQGTNSLTAK